MTIQVSLPDELVARIDGVADDRAGFVVNAVRQALRQSERPIDDSEVARINELAEELNREADDVLEYQVIS
jgi:metal-responsive CopG/Arc/MetJ family transcriptional regulator